MKGLLVCFAAGLALCSAANNNISVKFTVDPPQIDVNLTHTMTMGCSLDPSTSVKHLVSIVITRLDSTGAQETVASVSTFDTKVPDAAVDMNKITIDNTSSIASSVAASYLKLEWDHPTITQSRNYTCEINAIDNASHPTKFLKDFEVTYRVPTTEDLVHHIRNLEKNDEDKDARLKDLSARLSTLEQRVGSLEQKANISG